MKRQRLDRKKPRNTICPTCNESFIRHMSDNAFKSKPPKFCSSRCSAIYLGKNNKGENNGMFGKKSWCNGLTKDTDERVRSASEKKSGTNHHYYNKPLTEEHKEKISKSLRENERFMEFNSLSIEERMKRTYGENWENHYKEWKDSFKRMYSVEWFIDKYGKTEGELLYKERCENISKNSSFKKYNKENKNNWSTISQEIFWQIYESIKDRYEDIYFAELNNEYSCGTGKYNYDFVINDIKLIIEFNGLKFHPKEGDRTWVSAYGISYEEQRSKDIDKFNKARENGYTVMYIWEDDIYEDKINEILKLY